MTTPDVRRRTELGREALHTQADDMGRQLAAALNEDGTQGGGWTHQARPGYAYLCFDLLHPSGLHLALRHEKTHLKGSAGRMLAVSGIYPHGYCGLRAEPINVGIGTTAGHMARRITRSLLPDYLTTLDTALAQQRQDQEHEQNRRTLNRQMEQALPALHAAGHEPDHTRSARTSSYWYTSLPTMPGSPRALVSGRVRLSSSGTEAEELRLTGVPRELLLEILSLLNPSRPVEGRIMPRAVAPARRPLSATRIIPGEVVGSVASTETAQADELVPAPDAAQSGPAARREAAWHRLLITPANGEQPQYADAELPWSREPEGTT